VGSEYVEQREGHYFLTGSRVSLDSIIHAFHNGESPETIRENFPTLRLEQVYGAIAYYLRRQEELDVYLASKLDAFEKARRSQSHISTELRRRLERTKEQSSARRP
jgi:uncharacterized protein (DUF433 family)